jgi:hypothetical protein
MRAVDHGWDRPAEHNNLVGSSDLLVHAVLILVDARPGDVPLNREEFTGSFEVTRVSYDPAVR